MGFFNRLEVEILEWKARGRSVEDTYIYFKDYVSQEEVQRIFTEDYDTDPVETVQ